jgi:hypothetical protein
MLDRRSWVNLGVRIAELHLVLKLFFDWGDEDALKLGDRACRTNLDV